MLLNKSFFFVILFSFSLNYAAEFACINDDNVCAAERAVVHEIKRAQYIKASLACAGLALTGYAVHSLFIADAPTGSTSQELPKVPEVGVWRGMTEDQAKILLAMGERCGCSDPKTWGQVFYNWWSTVKQTGQTAIVYSLVSGTLTPVTKYFNLLDQAVDKVLDKIFFTPTLAWYLRSHNGLTQTSTLLQNMIVQLDASQTTMQQEHLFVATWNVYVRQLEGVLGFLRYKISMQKSSPAHTQQLTLFTQLLEETINTCSQECQLLLDARQWAQLKKVLQRLNDTLQSSFMQCSSLESFTHSPA
jgi:hypothetical protein